MEFGKSINALAASWMPDGKGGLQPVPDLMTESELIRYLRLDSINVKNTYNTLYRYRKMGLKAVQVSKAVLFPKKSVEEFIEKQIKSNPR